MTVREVPAIREDDAKLAQLKNWPKKREIDGWDCTLKTTEWMIDGRARTDAYYQCRRRWWPWGKPEMLGPFYSWTSDGQVEVRAYARSRTDAQTYQVDRSGRLVGFLDRKNGVIEYFDADGVLIGGEYAPVHLDWRSQGYRGGTVSVWLGERISHDEFQRRRKDVLNAAWGY